MGTSKRPKSDLPTVILHWGLAATLLFSLATGLRIAADMPDADWARAVSTILPQGNVISWHLWAALALLGVAVAYVVFLWRAGLFSRIALDAGWLSALQGGADRRQQWRAVNVAIYWLAFLSLTLTVVTGMVLDLAPGLAPFAVVATVHQLAAWSIPFYILVDIAALAGFGGFKHLLKILRPQPAYGLAAGAALIAGGTVAAGFYGVEKSAGDTLTVRRVDKAPVLDGIANDAVWAKMNEVDIHTMRQRARRQDHRNRARRA